LAPRRTSRSISGTAPTFQSRSTTAARHSQPWPRRKRGRLGLAVWLWWISEPRRDPLDHYPNLGFPTGLEFLAACRT
jgi:hypothetical protein